MTVTDATIRMLLEDFHRNVLPAACKKLVPRDLSLGKVAEPTIGGNAKVIVGMRRSGKTYRMFQEIAKLLDDGIPAERICYFNFDDDRLDPKDHELMNRVIEVFFDMHPASRASGSYLFLDEVQDVEGWGSVARRLLDTEKISLWITGSSSKLLAEDVATEFRGRSTAFELAPFSFGEYLRARGAEPTGMQAAFDKETASLLRNNLASYLVQGGFPAVQGMDDIERIQTLQTYVQLTVARDVVERIRFSNAAYARTLARAAVTSSARDFSISKMHARGKSSGYSPGRESIAALIDAFEDAHLVYQAYDFSYSAQKSRLGGCKLYAADPGMYNASMPASSDATTFAFETAVYLHLRRRRASGRLGDIAMLKLRSGKEVDFVEGDALLDTAYRLVQVSYDMKEESTREREVSALREAMAQFDSRQAQIITFNEEDEVHVPEGVIEIAPAWKWLL